MAGRDAPTDKPAIPEHQDSDEAECPGATECPGTDEAGAAACTGTDEADAATEDLAPAPDPYARTQDIERILLTTFSQNLNKLLSANNWTRKKFCDSVGVSNATLNHYKNARSLPPIEKLVLMAETFGITLPDLVLRPYISRLTEDQAVARNNESARQERSYYCGSYFIHFFNTSQPAGRDLLGTTASIVNGIICIKEVVDPMGECTYRAVAFIDIAEHYLGRVKAAVDQSMHLGITDLIDNVCNQFNLHMTDYAGRLQVNGNHVSLKLSVRNKDIIIHMENIAARTSNEHLRSSIGILSTVSHDQPPMPCAQKVLISAIPLTEPILSADSNNGGAAKAGALKPTLLFDAARMASFLQISAPEVDLGPLRSNFTTYIKALYADSGSSGGGQLAQLPDSYKDSLAICFLEDAYHHLLRNNYCRYIKVDSGQAYDFYRAVNELAHAQGLWLERRHS